MTEHIFYEIVLKDANGKITGITSLDLLPHFDSFKRKFETVLEKTNKTPEIKPNNLLNILFDPVFNSSPLTGKSIKEMIPVHKKVYMELLLEKFEDYLSIIDKNLEIKSEQRFSTFDLDQAKHLSSETYVDYLKKVKY